jgi:hypothetical protein
LENRQELATWRGGSIGELNATILATIGVDTENTRVILDHFARKSVGDLLD